MSLEDDGMKLWPTSRTAQSIGMTKMHPLDTLSHALNEESEARTHVGKYWKDPDACDANSPILSTQQARLHEQASNAGLCWADC